MHKKNKTTSDQLSTSSKLTKRSLPSLIISAVLAGMIVLVIFWLAIFWRPSSPPSPQALHYTLLGDPAWVGNRTWQENLATRQISHPDWTINFVLPPSVLADHEASVASLVVDPAIGRAPSFYLDKKLDDFVLTWSENVLRRQWQQLWQTATSASQQNLAREPSLARLNSWTRSLADQKLSLASVNFYLPLEESTTAAQTWSITAVWAVRRADQSTDLVTTPLVVNCDATSAHCAWEFNFVSLPLFTN